MRNEVYTCKTPECEKYLYNCSALLEIIVDGKNYAINPTLKHFEYGFDEAVIETVLQTDGYHLKKTVEAICPHCQKKASTTFIDFDVYVDNDKLMKNLDNLDAKIAEMLAKFETKETT